MENTKPKLVCKHHEGYVIGEDGKSTHIGESDKHDCQYVDRRNKLMVEAENRAMGRVISAGQSMNSALFARFFFEEMDTLAIERGLVQPKAPSRKAA